MSDKKQVMRQIKPEIAEVFGLPLPPGHRWINIGGTSPENWNSMVILISMMNGNLNATRVCSWWEFVTDVVNGRGTDIFTHWISIEL